MKMGDTKLVDTMMLDGLIDAFHGYHMGVTGTRGFDAAQCYISWFSWFQITSYGIFVLRV